MVVQTLERKVSEKIKLTYDTVAIRFPLEGVKFDFKPGQFIMLEVNLRETKDFKILHGKSKIQKRAYSISSTPFDRDYLEVVVKKREDGFVSKYLVDILKTGEKVKITGPYGHFVYEDKVKKAVFIGAGCGVAPFFAIFNYIIHKKLPTQVTVLLSNKRLKDVLRKADFDKLAKKPNFKIIHTITREEWKGEMGRLDADKIKKYVKDIKGSTYYLCAPPGMVEGMIKTLTDFGVPKKQIKFELF